MFFRLRKRSEKKTKKEPKNSDEHIAKYVRNAGKIRLYEKISIKRRNIIERPAARPLPRKRDECGGQRSVHHGYSFLYVFPGRFREIR